MYFMIGVAVIAMGAAIITVRKFRKNNEAQLNKGRYEPSFIAYGAKSKCQFHMQYKYNL